MRVEDINSTTVKRIQKNELLNLHFRIHQLYSQAKQRDNQELLKYLQEKHRLIVEEMERRNMKHESPLNMSLNLVRRLHYITKRQYYKTGCSSCHQK